MNYYVIGHRGWAGAAPENTLASFEMALSDPQCDVIECDVQMTWDGEIVVIHDFSIDRTSDGRGLVKSFTYNELLQYDFGAWFSAEYKGQRIPLLKELLELIGGKKRLQIEIKETANLYPFIADKLLDQIKTYPKDTLMIESFNHPLVKRIKELNPELCTGIICHDNSTLLMEQLQFTGSNFVSIFFGNITQELVNQLTDKEIEIVLWTLNQDWQYEYIQKFDGTFLIASDYPGMAVRNLGERALVK